ncbi:hypothetical protein ElyMa_000333300 [Elysia marginata]|uniref:Uncharacterized protein n=1 Tax=Elysia marginata TaxID=1093978 RepID=A0AAV4FBP1_9GAST|nr:hypothetical protein ElyMa_000333300 [Elysia marginata]
MYSYCVTKHNKHGTCIAKTGYTTPDGDEAKIAAMVPTGYAFISAPRTTREGGGIALFYKTAIKFVKEDKTRYSDSFEQLTVKIKTSKSYLTCVCVYRLHPKKRYTIFTNLFIKPPIVKTICWTYYWSENSNMTFVIFA